jgi:hypothetical protein
VLGTMEEGILKLKKCSSVIHGVNDVCLIFLCEMNESYCNGKWSLVLSLKQCEHTGDLEEGSLVIAKDIDICF